MIRALRRLTLEAYKTLLANLVPIQPLYTDRLSEKPNTPGMVDEDKCEKAEDSPPIASAANTPPHASRPSEQLDGGWKAWLAVLSSFVCCIQGA